MILCSVNVRQRLKLNVYHQNSGNTLFPATLWMVQVGFANTVWLESSCYFPDSGCRSCVQTFQKSTSTTCPSFYPNCLLTITFAALQASSQISLSKTNQFSPLVPVLIHLYFNRAFSALLLWSSQCSLVLPRWLPMPCQLHSLKVPRAPLQG